jgi:hypothetical protein
MSSAFIFKGVLCLNTPQHDSDVLEYNDLSDWIFRAQ